MASDQLAQEIPGQGGAPAMGGYGPSPFRHRVNPFRMALPGIPQTHNSAFHMPGGGGAPMMQPPRDPRAGLMNAGMGIGGIALMQAMNDRNPQIKWNGPRVEAQGTPTDVPQFTDEELAMINRPGFFDRAYNWLGQNLGFSGTQPQMPQAPSSPTIADVPAAPMALPYETWGE